MAIICTAILLYLICVVGRIILSWFPLAPGSIGAQVYSVLFAITEPALAPLRRVIPPVGMFDMSVLVLVIGLQLIRSIIC